MPAHRKNLARIRRLVREGKAFIKQLEGRYHAKRIAKASQ